MDFTAATARTPGSSPRSSAASRLISETTRNGPACISTWAITVSRVTFVTSPVNRLRADSLTTCRPGTGGAAAASSSAKRASSAPSTARAAVVAAAVASRPVSTQRRTVSSLTPSSCAASRIRKVATAPC